MKKATPAHYFVFALISSFFEITRVATCQNPIVLAVRLWVQNHREPSSESFDPEIKTTCKMFLAFCNFILIFYTVCCLWMQQTLSLAWKSALNWLRRYQVPWWCSYAWFGVYFKVYRNSRIIVISNLWSTTSVPNLSRRPILKMLPFTLKIGQSELASLPLPNGICFKKFSLDSNCWQSFCKLEDSEFALLITEFCFFDKMNEIEETGVNNSMKHDLKSIKWRKTFFAFLQIVFSHGFSKFQISSITQTHTSFQSKKTAFSTIS